MSLFGDDDPEDGWQADDPPVDRLINLANRLDYVRDRLVLRRQNAQNAAPEDQRRVLTILDDLSHTLHDFVVDPE